MDTVKKPIEGFKPLTKLFFQQLGGLENIEIMEIEEDCKSIFIKCKDANLIKEQNLFFFGAIAQSFNNGKSGTIYFENKLQLYRLLGLNFDGSELLNKKRF